MDFEQKAVIFRSSVLIFSGIFGLILYIFVIFNWLSIIFSIFFGFWINFYLFIYRWEIFGENVSFA